MKSTRRAFLAGLAAASATPRLGWAAVGSPAFLAAAQEPDGSFALYGLETSGQTTFRVPLPARGHAGAGHPIRAEAVAFARRPGAYALVIDAALGKVLAVLTPPEGRQFNGHGVYVDEGRTLLTVEQLAEGSEGRVGVWDVEAGYVRLGEFATHGIGPHDMKLMADGATLVVANGGIETDPTDRTKLNLPVMAPSLTYLDLSGKLLEEVRLEEELHQLSIRHLALGAEGQVAFAMQWEGEAGAAMPLLGLHRRGEEALLAEAPLGDELLMQGYAGSIAFAADGSELAISSPRGGRLHRFGPDGSFLGSVTRADVCGLAGHPEGLMASDGFGNVVLVSEGSAQPLARHEVAWDNHIVAL
jgi:hypothetical protein